MAVGLLIRGAGAAIKGIGKALKGKKTKDTTKGAASAFVKRRKQLKKKKRKSTNDPALTTGLALTGGASVGLLGKKIMDDKRKTKSGKTIEPKLGLPPKR